MNAPKIINKQPVLFNTAGDVVKVPTYIQPALSLLKERELKLIIYYMGVANGFSPSAETIMYHTGFDISNQGKARKSLAELKYIIYSASRGGATITINYAHIVKIAQAIYILREVMHDAKKAKETGEAPPPHLQNDGSIGKPLTNTKYTEMFRRAYFKPYSGIHVMTVEESGELVPVAKQHTYEQPMSLSPARLNGVSAVEKCRLVEYINLTNILVGEKRLSLKNEQEKINRQRENVNEDNADFDFVHDQYVEILSAELDQSGYEPNIDPEECPLPF